MPNVAPRGLFGRAQGVDTGPPSPAVEVVATGPGSTVPVPAVQVWASGPDGIPVLVWSATASPPTAAAAAYSGATGNVTITWTPAAVEAADTYTVKRADGSVAGSVGVGVNTLVDSSPRPLNGTYTVTASLGTVNAAPFATNSLTLAAAPASMSATFNAGTGNVDVVWTHPAYGAPHNYQVRRDGVAFTPNLSGTSVSFTDTTPPRGAQPVYLVYPMLSGFLASNASDVENVPAMVPTSVALTVPSPPPVQRVVLTWAAPASGVWTGFEVQKNVGGAGWVAHATVGSAVFTSTLDGVSTSVQMRVRALALGGASSYVTVGPVTPIVDVTPPANATITSWKPESSYGRMVVRATMPADADLADYMVEVNNGSGWTTAVAWTATTPGATIATNVLTASAGQTVQVRISVRDAIPNAQTGSGVSYGPLVASPIVVDATEGRTYRGGAWRTVGSGIQMGGTSSGENAGCWFYGETLRNAAIGKLIVSATLDYWRQDGAGACSALAPQFLTHNLATPVGTLLVNDNGDSAAARTGDLVKMPPPTCASGSITGGSLAMPAGFLAALAAGSVRGLTAYHDLCAMWQGGITYCYMLFGDAAVSGGSPAKVSGRVTINHLG